jgi:hypothetical protein
VSTRRVAPTGVVEIDVGDDEIARVTIAASEDPLAVAAAFCESRAFSRQIALPLAVKLWQARDMAERGITGRVVIPAADGSENLIAGRKERPSQRDPNAGLRKTIFSGWERDAKEVRPLSELSEEQQKWFLENSKPLRHHVNKPKKTEEKDPEKGIWGGGPGARSRKKRDVVAPKPEFHFDDDENRGDGQIFDRLYANAVRQREEKDKYVKQREAELAAEEMEERKARGTVMSKHSRELARGRNAGEYGSYNERLYAEAFMRAENLREKSRLADEERQREETAEMQTKPRISEYAASLVRTESPWVRLTEHHDAKFRQLAQIKRDMEERDLAECTFRPKISKVSKQMMKGRVENLREKGLSHHEQLYYDAGRRAMRREEFESWIPADHTFHPNAHRLPPHPTDAQSGDGSASLSGWTPRGEPSLNGSLPPWTVAGSDGGASGFHAPKVNHAAVVERLVASKKRSEEHVERLHAELYGPLFTPNADKPARDPNFPRNPAKLPVHDLLYANRHEFDDKKELLRMREGEKIREDAKVKVEARSARLVTQLKHRKFRQMFKCLDDVNSGVLYLREIDASRLEALVNTNADADDEKKDPGSGSPTTDGFGVVDDVDANDAKRLQTHPHVLEMIADIAAASELVGPDQPVDATRFVAAMDRVVSSDRVGRRAYLVPSTRYDGRSVRAEKVVERARSDQMMSVATAERTKKLATARLKKLGLAADVSIAEKLQREGEERKRRMLALTRSIEAETMADCTFTPQVNELRPGVDVRASMAETATGRAALKRDGSGFGTTSKATSAKNSPGSKAFDELERELEAVLASGKPPTAESLAASLRVEGTSPSPTKKGKGKKTSTSKAKTNELGGSDSDESDDFGVSDPEKLFPTA